MIRLYTDAAVNGDPGHAGIGLLILSDQEQQQYSIPLENDQWNNHSAEFHALLSGIRLLVDKKMTDQMTFCYTDSQIVAQSIDKSYVKDPSFKEYLTDILHLMDKFSYISVQWIPNRENKGADNLAKQALQKASKT